MEEEFPLLCSGPAAPSVLNQSRTNQGHNTAQWRIKERTREDTSNKNSFPSQQNDNCKFCPGSCGWPLFAKFKIINNYNYEIQSNNNKFLHLNVKASNVKVKRFYMVAKIFDNLGYFYIALSAAKYARYCLCVKAVVLFASATKVSRRAIHLFTLLYYIYCISLDLFFMLRFAKNYWLCHLILLLDQTIQRLCGYHVPAIFFTVAVLTSNISGGKVYRAQVKPVKRTNMIPMSNGSNGTSTVNATIKARENGEHEDCSPLSSSLDKEKK